MSLQLIDYIWIEFLRLLFNVSLIHTVAVIKLHSPNFVEKRSKIFFFLNHRTVLELLTVHNFDSSVCQYEAVDDNWKVFQLPSFRLLLIWYYQHFFFCLLNNHLIIIRKKNFFFIFIFSALLNFTTKKADLIGDNSNNELTYVVSFHLFFFKNFTITEVNKTKPVKF